MHSIQTDVCIALLEGRPAPGYVEEESVAQLADFLVRKGGDPSVVQARHSVLRWDGES